MESPGNELGERLSPTMLGTLVIAQLGTSYKLPALLMSALFVVALPMELLGSTVVLDFDSLDDTTTMNISTSYSEDGFDLNITTGISEFAVIGQDRKTSHGDYTGTPALVVNQAGSTASTVVLDRGGVLTFDATSIDLAQWVNGSSTRTIGFTGNLQLGGTVMQTMTIPPATFTTGADLPLTTYNFSSGFQDLVSLSWVIDVTDRAQWDNIVLEAGVVPEPSTVGLALVGLLAACAGMFHRTRRSR